MTPTPASARAGLHGGLVRGAHVRVQALDGGAGGPGGGPVLAGLELEALPGSVTAVLGPNGSGKSTLLSILGGLRRPLRGRVEVDGLAPLAFRRRRGMGILPDPPRPPPGWTVAELLATGAAAGRGGRDPDSPHPAGPPPPVDPELESLGGRRVDHLSRGWTRRVLLAFLVAGRPPLLLLDEPASGVDATAGPGVAHLLRRAAHAGTTVIVATHDTGVARAADRALLLVRGALREVTRSLGASSGTLPSTGGPTP